VSGGPLAGLRVLELGQIASAPFAGSLMADLGADVVKIEPPKGGDGMRNWPPFTERDGERFSENFASLNRGKRSVALDLKSEAGLETMLRLVRAADVLVENYRPGALERLGLGHEPVREANPRLVYCSISGYGASGPYSRKGAFDVTIQAAAGLMDVTGEADGNPVKCGVPVADFVAALYAVVCIVASTSTARATGVGAYVDCSMLGAVLGIAALQTSEYFGTGKSPKRLGADHPRNAPYGLFRGSDGPFVLAAGTDELWRRFCEVLEVPELADDERFVTQELRAANQTTLQGLVAPVFARRPVREWLPALEAAGIPCAPIATFAEALASPEVEALELIKDLPLPNGTQTKTVIFPTKVSDFDPPEPREPPLLGQHTEEVVGDWAGAREEIGS